MRRHRVMMALAGATAIWCVAPLAVSAAPTAWAAVTSAGTWGTAFEVPGLGSLNQGGQALLVSLSCASAGNCAAGGSYKDAAGHKQVFVVSESNGRWGTAIEVPGSGSLNAGGAAEVTSVSCASAGNCVVGGDYNDGSHRVQAFVVSEVNGTWSQAIKVPGTLNVGFLAKVTSVSCASAGNCVAGGFYTDSSNLNQAFVVSETNGTWGTAIEVPGSGTLNKGGDALVFSVSCASAGNCAAGGAYHDGSHIQAFAASETNGTWGTAIEVPGSATLNAGGDANLASVWCTSAGNCAGGGNYMDGATHLQAFVVSEHNGVWGKARQVPGSGTLNAGGQAEVASLSCASAGNCAAGGDYKDGSGHTQTFVASETNGTWRTAIEVPGLGALNAGGFADLPSVSCASAGSCSAGGSYEDGSGHPHAFVVSERSGTWGTAIEVPGSATLDKGGEAGVKSVSCRLAGHCAAVGNYIDGSGHFQAFVVSQA